MQVEIGDLFRIDEDENSYDGIEINEEWLIKFGFKKDGRSYKLKNFGRFIFHLNGVFFYPAGYLDSLFRRDILKYVHQLENLYFALTGEELIIKK